MTLDEPFLIVICVYCCCGVLLVCDIVLILYLCLRCRRNGSRTTNKELGCQQYILYAGFKRIPSQQLQCSAHPGRYKAPFSITISECPLTSSCCCPEKDVDILLDIQRGPLENHPGSPFPSGVFPSQSTPLGSDGRLGEEKDREGRQGINSPASFTRDWAHGSGSGGVDSGNGEGSRTSGEHRRYKEVELLGWDAYYDDGFSLYVPGSALHFTQPGTYRVQAYTICPKGKKVSMVHQWIFDVESAFDSIHAEDGYGARVASPEKSREVKEEDDEEEKKKKQRTGRGEGGRREGSGSRPDGELRKQRKKGTHSHHKASSSLPSSSSTSLTCSSSAFTSAETSRSTRRRTSSSSMSAFSSTMDGTTYSGGTPGKRHHSHGHPHRPHRRHGGGVSSHGHPLRMGSYPLPPSHHGEGRRHPPRSYYSPTPELAKHKPLRAVGYHPSYDTHGLPLPPRIVPAGGVITSATPIHLHSAISETGNVEEFRYSIDGSYPSRLYTGPFQVPPPDAIPTSRMGTPVVVTGGGVGLNVGGTQGAEEGRVVVVKAISLTAARRSHHPPQRGAGDLTREYGGGGVGTSAVTEAVFRVVHAPTAFFDPVLPSPSLHVRALDAKLYFDMNALEKMWEHKRQEIPLRLPASSGAARGASGGGGSSTSRLRVVFQCYAVDLTARPSGPPPLDPSKAQVYAGVPVTLPCHLTRLYAWTVIEGVGHSAPTVYEPGKEVILEPYDATSSPHYQHAFLPPSSSAQAFSGALPPPFPVQSWEGGDGTAGGERNTTPLPSSGIPLLPPPTPPPSFSLPPPTGPLSPPPAPPQQVMASAQFLNPFIPSPVVCVSCKEIELCFADPPAHTRIAYTLNRTEPTLTDVSPPASAALSSAVFPFSSAGGGASLSPPICGRGDHTPAMGPLWPPDSNGLHTFFYESGRWIRVSLLEPDGLHVTARIFKPVVNSGSSTSLCRGYGCHTTGDPSSFGYRSTSPPEADAVHTTTGGTLVGYRFSAAFHRGFYYQEKKLA